ncbi:MAG TPA: Holliday junction resolvase RuvX [Anaerolineales bacterium]|nr:Holliday junction resolvase RuvX [Anaerolineales bacterium]
MRVLAVDPGDKRLGIALSDPSGRIANPLTVLAHESRAADAECIARIAREQEAGLIVIGQPFGSDGPEAVQARKAARLAAALRSATKIPVRLWDESGSTAAAREAQIAIGTPSRKRRGHLDDLAATVILQSYLDAHPQ